MLLLGVMFFWTPVVAEEVTGQEQDVSLYLYSENGIGKLHTRETGNHGDTDEVQINQCGNLFFALNYSLQDDLLAK